MAKLIEEIKTGSSKWFKKQEGGSPQFVWQSGYGIFSIGQSDLPKVIHYIDCQEEHHRKKTFQDELRELLAENRITHDERWLWD